MEIENIGSSNKLVKGHPWIKDVGANFDKNKFNVYRKPTDSNFKKFNNQSATNKFQEQ